MRYILRYECTYCGNSWIERPNDVDMYFTNYRPDNECPKCKDKHVKKKEEELVDYYGDNDV